ncbi:MAG: CHASE2 domain-containing protein [Sideroxydans sp.]|nr:CHASE2 domain-containing protein [Sideroxydans sp.]
MNNLKLILISRLRFAMVAWSELLAKYLKRSFYLYLAGVFSVFAVLDTTVLHITSEMRTAAFDAMVRYRVFPPKPDPDIIIVDINEASLAAMSKDYGRWPWPRQVLGEFVENIEKQHPKAVVFDVLFSDADIYNPDSDAYFDAAIAGTNNTFFPMLRLDPSADALSELKTSQIPGASAVPDEQAKADATVALVLPHFESALTAGRLGTHNVYPDVDGVVRNYPVHIASDGWRLPSLPSRMGSEFGWKEPSTESILLNWRGKPFSYQYVSFSDVFADMSSKNKQRAQDEFKDKIIIIGSTAPGLFDIRTTPMARMYPGVEILATAIDNHKHADSLRFPEGRIWYLLITLALIWATAWAFYREEGRGNIDKLFGLSQIILIGFSFASINFSNTYINLAGPVMLGIAYFSLARLYATATGKALEKNMVREATAREGDVQATLMLIRFDTNLNVVPDAILEKIRLGVSRIGSPNKSVEVVSGDQKGLWGLFEKTIAISWVEEANSDATRQQIEADAALVLAELPSVLKRFLLNVDNATRHVVQQGMIEGGGKAEADWRLLFAEALIKWHEQERKQHEAM